MAAQLLLINPKRRKRRRNARRRVARRRHVARNPVRRRRRRHTNARRVVHRRRHVARNPRRRHRRYGRNPMGSVGGAVKSVESNLVPAAIGAAGAVVVDVAYGFAAPYLPTVISGNIYGKAVVEIAGALGVGFLAGKVMGREKGHAAMLGAMTVAAYTVLTDLLANSGILSGLGAYMPGAGMGRLGAYMQPGMGRLGAVTAYNPAAYIQGPSTQPLQYASTKPLGAGALGAYMPDASQLHGAYSEDMFFSP